MGRLPRAALTVALAFSALDAAAAEPAAATKPGPEQIASLVRDLGSDRFSTREAASDRLARLGLPAFTALEEATRHTDREIRFRAERILTVIRKNDLERRLAAFVAGTGKEDYDLPAWSRFSKGYGDSEASRQMFVEMQRAEPELLSALEREPRAAVEVLGRRLAERMMNQARVINTNLPSASAGEVSAYLFVAAEEDATVSASSLQLLLSLSYQPVRLMIRSPKQGELTKKMVANVIRRCDVDAALSWMGLARELELKEGLVLALKVLERHDRLNQSMASVLAAALACIADLGDESQVPAVEKLLDNKIKMSTGSVSVIENGQRVIRAKEMQVRDAALATLVMLTKQDAKEYYGQEIAARNAANPSYSTFPALIVGFETGENGETLRAAAQKKWADYKARQKEPPAAPAAP